MGTERPPPRLFFMGEQEDSPRGRIYDGTGDTIGRCLTCGHEARVPEGATRYCRECHEAGRADSRLVEVVR